MKRTAATTQTTLMTAGDVSWECSGVVINYPASKSRKLINLVLRSLCQDVIGGVGCLELCRDRSFVVMLIQRINSPLITSAYRHRHCPRV